MHIELVTKAPQASALGVLLGEEGYLSSGAEALAALFDNQLLNILGRFGYKPTKGKVQILSPRPQDEAAAFVAIGIGPQSALDAMTMESLMGSAYQATKSAGFSDLAIDLTGFSADLVAHALLGLHLASYRFDAYFGPAKQDKAPSLKTISVITSDVGAAQKAFEAKKSIIEGVTFARNLVSEPANVIYPQSYADRVKAYESLGLKVEVLGEAEMQALGMHSLLGVGLGSEKESKLVIIQWLGAEDPKAQPVAFVGKGVTFDTGGISIKPAEGMEDMKWDMGGSAAVAGLMVALAGRKAKANVIGILGLVENMPDGKAQRPGDVVRSMSGQTIEVINTDAEGRLVLADALWYCQDRFKPRFMIDLATLTGAMIIALGTDYAGVFSNNDELADQILKASASVKENMWRMPLPTQYEKQIESKIADLKNTGGRAAGSITAALFLQKFVNGVPWAHLDIAPTAWTNELRNTTVPEGATGFGVRALDALVAQFYEG